MNPIFSIFSIGPKKRATRFRESTEKVSLGYWLCSYCWEELNNFQERRGEGKRFEVEERPRGRSLCDSFVDWLSCSQTSDHFSLNTCF